MLVVNKVELIIQEEIVATFLLFRILQYKHTEIRFFGEIQMFKMLSCHFVLAVELQPTYKNISTNCSAKYLRLFFVPRLNNSAF